MDLYTNTSNLHKSIPGQAKSNAPNGTRIGTKVNASIAKNLGGGKYILNLGGSNTIVVQSQENFQEKENVELEIRSNNEGKVELKLISRQAEQNTAAAKIIGTDSATINKDIQIYVSTNELPEINKAATDELPESNKNSTNGLPEISNAAAIKTSDTTENMQAQANTPSQPNSGNKSSAEIQLIINYDNKNPETSPSIKIILPDGNVIDAEIIAENSEPQQTAEESKINNPIKDIIFKNKTSEETSQTEDSADIVKSPSGSIKNILTAIVDKMFSKEAIAALPETDRANIAKMIINEITLPILISESSKINNPTSSDQTLDKEIGITFKYLDIGNALNDILSKDSNLSLSQTNSDEYALKYTASNGEKIELPVPQANNELIKQAISPLTEDKIELPAQLGIKSLLQGIIQENIKNSGEIVTTIQQPNLTKPQEDQTKLDAIIRSSGTTPSIATRDAARALLDNAQLVSRDNIHSLLALSAGKTGAERIEFLNAGAKLIALDAPLSPALASGISKLATDGNLMHESITKIDNALNAAKKNIPIDRHEIDTTATGAALKNLQNVANSLDRASQTLKGIPILIEALGNPTDERPEIPSTNESNLGTAKELESFISSSARERLGTVENMIQTSAEQILLGEPILSRLSKALDTILNKLGNLPDTQQEEAIINEKGENIDLEKLKGVLKADLNNLNHGDTKLNLGEIIKDIPLLRERFAHPGINNMPEFWQKVDIDSTTLENSDFSKIKQTIEQILTAQTPEKAQHATKEMLRTIDRDTLRTLASTLQEIEREEMQKHPALQSLKEANKELRELGRALVAQKAENLSNSRNDPASFNTSIPFNFNNENGDGEDGKLSMFYNKSKSKKGNWQQRVLLDLNMSVLGNIIGDIQFHEGIINVSFISSNKNVVSILEKDKDELLSGLEDLGFQASVGVRLLEPKTEKATNKETPLTLSKHLLDVKA